ncbi:hypothetical protein [Convivina praedatoris]|uniref:Uncharacterized protein n=1 Tax=Convivina praedatoris TaxID=2880963 RepID=A0ABN8H7T0_9LACO|nr:hypothetical protein [Convivina sp. LMG 32447]CAH1851587.1 hypothetical protein LMG032447_00354 [Convivina sp. LMG 32447]CAH1851612.1 hypothetical protein R078138_00364 [Convivina sp. LMG 32447]CAH1853198.1 hypothetical protein R077815_00753 [Convivina sp. LMG 32447]
MDEIVTIHWIGWIKKLKRRQALALSVAFLVFVLLIMFQGNSGNYQQFDWKQIVLVIYFFWSFSPAGEQLAHRAFPYNKPRFQYQVTTWYQWGQALLFSGAFFVVSLFIWRPQYLADISSKIVIATIIGFVAMWLHRWLLARVINKKYK